MKKLTNQKPVKQTKQVAVRTRGIHLNHNKTVTKSRGITLNHNETLVRA